MLHMIITKDIVNGVLIIEKETSSNLYGSNMQFLYKILVVSNVLAFIVTPIESTSILFAIVATISSILFFIGFCKTYYAYITTEKNEVILESTTFKDQSSAKENKKITIMVITGVILLVILLLIGIF